MSNEPTPLDDYPNLDAILNNTISGRFSEWPLVAPELRRFAAEMAALREQLAEAKAATERWKNWHRLLKTDHATLTAEVGRLKQDGVRLEREKWDMDALHDLYHDGGAPLVDFLVDYVLGEFNKQLGGKGWEAYDSDGGLDDAIGYNVHTLLKKNKAIEEWGNRPLGPVLMALIRLSDNESKRGKFRVILDYDNYQDGGRVLNGDEKVLGECYEDRQGNTDEEGPDNQMLGAVIAAVDAALSAPPDDTK